MLVSDLFGKSSPSRTPYKFKTCPMCNKVMILDNRKYSKDVNGYYLCQYCNYAER